MSFNRAVVAELPSVFQSSRPDVPSSALKKVDPAAGVNSLGEKLVTVYGFLRRWQVAKAVVRNQ